MTECDPTYVLTLGLSRTLNVLDSSLEETRLHKMTLSICTTSMRIGNVACSYLEAMGIPNFSAVTMSTLASAGDRQRA